MTSNNDARIPFKDEDASRRILFIDPAENYSFLFDPFKPPRFEDVVELDNSYESLKPLVAKYGQIESVVSWDDWDDYEFTVDCD